MPEDQDTLSVLARRVFQVSFVVKDRQAAEIAAHRIGAGTFRSLPDVGAVEETYDGRPSEKASASVSMAQLGNLQLELVQVESGHNVQSDYIQRHGHGLHHIGFHAGTPEEFGRLETDLVALGFPVVQKGKAEDGTLYSYLDADSFLGCYLLLVHPGSKLKAFYDTVRVEASGA
jgi:hypothetical protein